MATPSRTVSAIDTGKAARFHGAGQPLAEGPVVFDDQKRAFLGNGSFVNSHGSLVEHETQ